MALAKVYDDSQTLMVPLDLDGTEGLSAFLYTAAARAENSYDKTGEAEAEALRNLADAIDDARISAGLGA